MDLKDNRRNTKPSIHVTSLRLDLSLTRRVREEEAHTVIVLHVIAIVVVIIIGHVVLIREVVLAARFVARWPSCRGGTWIHKSRHQTHGQRTQTR